VKEAFDLGINFFDTSPFYGDTKSETVSCATLRRCSARSMFDRMRHCSVAVIEAGCLRQPCRC
jgi:predicted oxidoreductase